MGVPAFFRWLMLKYPKVIVNVLEEKAQVVDGITIPLDCTKPNPNGIEFDNLYLDMNGIVHNCSHGEDLPRRPETEEEMFDLVCKYIDRLMAVARPRRLLYMAVDGCAPRAKMNQQRSRRFKAAEERVEMQAIEARERQKLEARGVKVPPKKKASWDHNVITPGTNFMMKLSKHLRYYVHDRQTNSPHWRNIRVILSDGSVPGEGEHKIMDFIRGQRASPGYDPNMKHILHGLDADLIMLGLATHEADFTIFREQVFAKKGKEETKVADNALFDKPLQFLRIPILREYLRAEFEGLAASIRQSAAGFEYDFERVCDDFVFLCFFVGNDFLPHLPSLDIREGGIAILINIYKRLLPSIGGYLTNSGKINLRNVDVMLAKVAETEELVFQRRRAKEAVQERRKKKMKTEICRQHLAGRCKRGKRCNYMHVERPPRNQLHALGSDAKLHGSLDGNKSAADALRSRLGGGGGGAAAAAAASTKSDDNEKTETMSREVYDKTIGDAAYDSRRDDSVKDNVRFGEDGWKTRYYQEKFPERAKTAEGLKKLQRDMMQSYVEGLQWVLRYYYEGCVSWSWFYPFHYAPCASDLRNVDTVEIEFELSKPFKPVDQLMGVQPAAGAHMLPKACRPLMKDSDSPIIDFYPLHFKQDTNGKPQKWLWIALLPFIDEVRLKKAIARVESEFTAEERERNETGHDLLFVHFGSKEAHVAMESKLNERPDASATKTGEEGEDGAMLTIDKIDTSSGLSVAGTWSRSRHFVPKKATIQSPDDADSKLFPPMPMNLSLAIRFRDPFPRRPHVCRLLPGSDECEPVLNAQDRGSIAEPRLGRRGDMRFDDLGKIDVTPQMLAHEKRRAQIAVDGPRRRDGPPSYALPQRVSRDGGRRSWGSMEPSRRRPAPRVHYGERDYGRRNVRPRYDDRRYHHPQGSSNHGRDPYAPSSRRPYGASRSYHAPPSDRAYGGHHQRHHPSYPPPPASSQYRRHPPPPTSHYRHHPPPAASHYRPPPSSSSYRGSGGRTVERGGGRGGPVPSLMSLQQQLAMTLRRANGGGGGNGNGAK